jgi:phosphoglycerol transferase MdoB-like AlkP superfamily enzyme
MPEALARCGYRNVVFYPMMRNFVSNAKFYTAVGMPEIFDYKDQGAKRFDERDRFYYENALKLMDRHIRLSRRPLFTFILTMAAHSPYDDRYEPQVDVPGGGPGTHPEMHEYLRRLGMARMDYDYLRSELQRRYPDERFMIVQYGDHQPMATRTMLGYTDAYDPEDMLMPIDSPGFITYFAIDGQNYRPPPLPDVDTLDVPYLGTLILEAAGLPPRTPRASGCGSSLFAADGTTGVSGGRRSSASTAGSSTRD